MNRIRILWKKSIIRKSVSVLNRRDQQKLIFVAFLQSLLGLLDLLGIVVIGIVGALTIEGIQPQKSDRGVNAALNFLHISSFSFYTQITILSALALSLLIGKTVLSIFFTRRILFFLSRKSADISASLVLRLLSQPLLTVQARTTQQTLYALTIGVQFIMINVVANMFVLISDVSLLLLMAFGLFILDTTTAIGTMLIFCLVGLSLHRLMNARAKKLGIQNSELNIKSNEMIIEVFSSYRESVVRNRRHYYAREIGKIRFDLADTVAEQNFMPYISKYVVETSVILGAILLGVTQFILQDVGQAVTTLIVFLAAGTRIAPAVLRIQQGSISIRGGMGAATPTLDLIDTLGNELLIENSNDIVDVEHGGFSADISIKNVSLTYPSKSTPAIYNIDLIIPAGASVALVGPTGSGKTTLIDSLLGVLKPDQGTILISGMSPSLCMAKWPGAVSYVPQDVMIVAGTIRENVALGYPRKAATDALVMSALKIAQLDQFALNLPQGIDTQVGERGTQLSGGQRQRLGIARAMFTKPLLLVLDEATSALDGETEASLSQAIGSLRGSTTVVLIAHRLSTVRNMDVVVYLSQGNLVFTGSFEEVRKSVPNFNNQASLMGL